jgi:hypothetical protein
MHCCDAASTHLHDNDSVLRTNSAAFRAVLEQGRIDERRAQMSVELTSAACA